MEDQFRNPFKELDKKLHDAPPGMRKKVMNDVAIAKLVMDISILVTSNYMTLLSRLFKTKDLK